MNFDERRAPMKIVIGLLAAAILGTGGFAFAAGVDDTQPARTVSVPGTTTAVTTAATTAATTTDDIVIGNAPAATTTANGEDISGPCDEAEHANDPRCTGAGAVADDDNDDNDDNSGHGSGHDNDDDNPGHGSGHDDNDDNSGHGSGHDDNDD
jgi:hypothetical protein